MARAPGVCADGDFDAGVHRQLVTVPAADARGDQPIAGGLTDEVDVAAVGHGAADDGWGDVNDLGGFPGGQGVPTRVGAVVGGPSGGQPVGEPFVPEDVAHAQPHPRAWAVSGPTTPSAVRWWCSWNMMTACSTDRVNVHPTG